MFKPPASSDVIVRSVTIAAPPPVVWRALTDLSAIPRWMGDDALPVDVTTTWALGSPIVVRGFHHVAFENDGVVLAWDPPRRLRYSHRSSLSRLPATPDTASILTFDLEPEDDGTTLTLHIEQFPTMTIHRHLDFYWRGTLPIFKRFVEGGLAVSPRGHAGPEEA